MRSFGQLIGHIADSQFGMCATAAGEKPAQFGIEKSATSKAALVQALDDSIADCDKVLTAMDDKKGAEVTKFFTGRRRGSACSPSTTPTATNTTATW